MIPAEEYRTSGEDPDAPASLDALRAQTEEAADRILSLAREESPQPISDLEQTRSIAKKIKPYIDRATTLKRLPKPVHRIVSNRTQMSEIQTEIIEDVAQSGSIWATVKKDRKISVSLCDAEDQKPSNKALGICPNW